MSFIEKAKLKGANALLGTFTCRNGFDDKFKGLRIDHVRITRLHRRTCATLRRPPQIEDGRVECSITVEPHIQVRPAPGPTRGGHALTAGARHRAALSPRMLTARCMAALWRL